MQVTINGKSEQLDDGTTITALIERFELKPQFVAVEVNEDLVPRKQFAQTELNDGDCIEIVTLVGGG